MLGEAEGPGAEDAELGPALAEAEEEVGREDRTLGAAVTDVIDEAEAVTAEVERATTLFETLAKGGALDPTVLREEVDSLLDRLAEMDRSGRLAEALRLARALERLLALVRRWRDLGQTLATAARAARGLGDQPGMAWVRHELGTVQLVGGDPTSAERNLDAARELRRELGDEVGLAATERNMLSVCREQRRLLREEQSNGGISWRRLAAGAIALLIAGGALGALINSGDGGQGGTDLSATACFDSKDNDGDELIDADDPGCTSSDDDNEADPPAFACSDGEDNDGDELIDADDPGCTSSDDDDETDPLPACSDGEDNDGDQLIDADDPGCTSSDDDDEADAPAFACSDGEDNDGDELIDFPDDPGCTSADDDDETNPTID